MLIAGRLEPKTGLAGRQAKARIAIRAMILLALGTAMAMAYGGVVILAFYAVYLLLALPLVRLPARTLAIITAVLAVVMPPLAHGLRTLLTEPVTSALKAYDPLDRIGVDAADGRAAQRDDVGTCVFAVIWSRFFRRGPLEHLLHAGEAHPVRSGRGGSLPRPTPARTDRRTPLTRRGHR